MQVVTRFSHLIAGQINPHKQLLNWVALSLKQEYYYHYIITQDIINYPQDLIHYILYILVMIILLGISPFPWNNVSRKTFLEMDACWPATSTIAKLKNQKELCKGAA